MSKCENCGHKCHCKDEDCEDCINDVCVRCKCKNESEIPTSFIKSPG
jgi:hypothetical protein